LTHQYPKRYQKWKRRAPKPTDERATPQDFFDGVNKRFKFNLDVAASHENHTTPHYFTQVDDGLSRSWDLTYFGEEGKGRVWCNPPYSDIPSWIMKAHEEFANGSAELIVMLLPADVSTDWYHDLLMGGPTKHLQFVYLRGRLKFAGENGAKFPSMLVIWEKPITA
jgi:phage N-6-adenine-methyltransferase